MPIARTGREVPYLQLHSEKPTGEHVIIIQSTESEATHADVSLSDRGSYLQTTGVCSVREAQ